MSEDQKQLNSEVPLQPQHTNASPQIDAMASATPPIKRSRKKKLIIIALCLVMLLGIGLLFIFHITMPMSKTSIASKPPLSAGANTGTCTPNAILINPCRAWFGAAASGNPGVPGQPEAKDAVSQFTFLEQLIGHQLDMYRTYHAYPASTSTTSDQPLNASELHFAARPNTYLDINWNPSQTWQQSFAVRSGGSSETNTNIDKVAASIKSVEPHQVFLSLWHEADILVSSGNGCSSFSSGERAAGSPAQFNEAYQNVYNRFKADGVTNVVWVLDYASSPNKICWVPQLWPGNSYIDWVIYDTYSRGKTWDDTSGVFYNFLEQHNSTTTNYESKPWGIGEFGTCKQPAGISQDAYYQSIIDAVKANTYPRLKMYLVYADTGNNSGDGCLTNYDDNGSYDPGKQQVFNQLVDTILGTTQ